MSTTTQVTTRADLVTALMNKMRVDTSITATSGQAQAYIDSALQDMHLGNRERFPWAERDAILTTQASYSTGTVTITQGSTTLTGASTLWNTANAFGVKNARAGGKIVISGGSEVYEVVTVSSDTAITLRSAFTQSDVSAGSYVYFEDEYDLASDFLRPLDVQFFTVYHDVEIVNRSEFRRLYPRRDTAGKPAACCIVDRAPSGNTTPRRRILFSRPTDAAYTLPYAYVTKNLVVASDGTAKQSFTADTDEPIVPFGYRHAIVLHAAYNWYRDKKNDARSQEARAEYTDIILRITADVEVGAQRPRLKPRVSPYARAARTPYRGRGGRGVYSTGSSFDEIR